MVGHAESSVLRQFSVRSRFFIIKLGQGIYPGSWIDSHPSGRGDAICSHGIGSSGEISRPEDRGKNMGFFGLCETFGSSLGPLLGGFLLDRFPAEPLYLWGPIALSSFAAASGFALWQGYSQAEVAGDLAVERQNGVTK